MPSPPPWPLVAKAGAAVALVVILITTPWWATLFADAFRNVGEGIVKIFGIGLLPAAAVCSLAAWLKMGRPVPQSQDAWRQIGGAAILLLAVNGILSLFEPDWQVGDVTMAQVSAGGNFGRLLTDGAPGILALALLWTAGVGLVWPGSMVMVGGASLSFGHWLASQRLPQKTAHALKATLERLFNGKAGEPAAASGIEIIINGKPTSTLAPPGGAERQNANVIEGTVIEREPESAPPAPEAPVPQADSGQAPSFARPFEREGSAGAGWETPPMDILKVTSENAPREADIAARAQLIVDTLSSFGVDARVVQINQGPAVTQFGVEPGWEVKTRVTAEKDASGRPVPDKDGKPRQKTEIVSRTRVRVNQITTLANDLALALAAPSIRIEAPVPGKPIVGIEVPNTTLSVVTLRGVIESQAFQKITARSKVALALGRGVSGEPIAADLARMPHLLIAGATGSGKSVCINSIITCILMHATPDEVRFVIIDPKRVELTPYAGIPHLAFSSIITEMDEVAGVLQAVIQEMEERYRLFAARGVRNIESYNRSPKGQEKMPYWVVVIDELADLMMSAPYQVERQICRLAQLARATGIHLIVATQRPSVDVVTGLIKANFPTRIAFAVTSQVDSRTIIDGGGAEKLLGRGDMLFMATDAAKPRRLQGVYLSDQEIETVIEFWKSERFQHMRPRTADDLLERAKAEVAAEKDSDELLSQARDLAMEHTRISTSLLQRKLHVGYPRAARLIDCLEEEGIIGPPEGGQSRRVLLGSEDAQDDLDGPEGTTL